MKKLMLEYRIVNSKKNPADRYAIAKYMDIFTGYIYPDVFCAFRNGNPESLPCPCLVEADIIPKPGRDGKMSLEIVAITECSPQLDLDLIFSTVDTQPIPRQQLAHA